MQLTLEQIKQITVGAVDIYEDESGIHFKRFTKQQLATWSACCEQFRLRSNCTAGCQLSFYTDATKMDVDVAAGVKYEILVDGLPAHFFALEEPQCISAELPAGEKHVVLSLPNYSEGIIKSIRMNDGATIRPYTYQKRFLFLGDSITQGSQSTRDSFCYAYRTSRFFDAQILNLGIGGSYMMADTLEDVGFDPDVVFIAYGSNDYTRQPSLEVLENSCKEYFDRVKALYGDKKIFYISPIWRADGTTQLKTGTLDDCRRVLIAQCLAHGFTHIDGYKLVPNVAYYLNDGYLHPSDAGFSFYAENLIKTLLNYL